MTISTHNGHDAEHQGLKTTGGTKREVNPILLFTSIFVQTSFFSCFDHFFREGVRIEPHTTFRVVFAKIEHLNTGTPEHPPLGFQPAFLLNIAGHSSRTHRGLVREGCLG